MPPADPPTPTHEAFAGRLAECAKHMRQPDGRLLWEMASQYIASAAINESRIAELEKTVGHWKDFAELRGRILDRFVDALGMPKEHAESTVEKAEEWLRGTKGRIAELEREVAQMKSQAATNAMANHRSTHCCECGRTLRSKCYFCEE